MQNAKMQKTASIAGGYCLQKISMNLNPKFKTTKCERIIAITEQEENNPERMTL